MKMKELPYALKEEIKKESKKPVQRGADAYFFKRKFFFMEKNRQFLKGTRNDKMSAFSRRKSTL